MKRLLFFLSRGICFWFFVFLVNRVTFLLSAISFLPETTFPHALRALVSGWLLDLSSIGYLMALPGLLYAAYTIHPAPLIRKIGNVFAGLFIIIYCLICFGELLLYREWMTKLTMQALLHFRHPAEVFRTAQLHTAVIFFLGSGIFSAAYIYLWIKKVSGKRAGAESKIPVRQKLSVAAFALLVFIPFDFLAIRGGWSAIPISDSDAYYSPHHVLNDAAVNPLWSLGHNILEYVTHQEDNPYVFMTEEEAGKEMEKIFRTAKDTTIQVFTVQKPNIVILILEGFTSYALPSLGGDNFAPFLDSLSRAGISFTHCYAAAYASDQGIPAVLSAYPSTPKVAITNQSSKTKDLPCISRDLKALGYQSGFVFGGQLNYGNIRSYLFNAQFDKLYERKDFSELIPDGHLGIHDKDMAPLVIGKLNEAKPPFVYAWFTVSSHSPYDIPVPMVKLTDSRQNEYVNTLVYSDQAVRDFFAAAKKESWYANTVFVVVSDHSHFNQRDISIEDKEYHHIVCFYYGDVIRPEYRGMRIEKTVSQLDVTPTLLEQFGKNVSAYRFGKNALNPTSPSFAYFDFHYGSGMITDSCFITRQDRSDHLLVNTCTDAVATGLRHAHEAFLQETFGDYLRR